MDKLSVRTKLSYGSGDFGLAFTSGMLGLLFAVFLTDVVGLRPATAGICVLVGRVWDFINDPIMGYISDRTRSRLGRRRPYILYGAIPFSVAFALLWWIPPIGSELGLAIYYSAAYFLFDTMVTIIFIPYVALTPELSDRYDDRTSLTSFRMVFSLVGSMLAFVLPLALIGEMRPDNATRVGLVAAGVAVATALPFFIVFAGVREDPRRVEHAPKAPLMEAVRAALRNRPFLLAAAIYLATITGFEISTSMIIYFFKYALGISTGAQTYLGIMFVVSLLAIPLWNLLSRRWDKNRAYIVAMVALAALRLLNITFTPETPPVFLYTIVVATGIFLSAGQILPWAIVPDTVEYDEYLTGARHEGMFYSFMALARKVASAIALPSVLFLMDFAGYRADAASQSAGAILAVRGAFGIVPVVLFVLGIAAAVTYPLKRERFDEIRRALEARREGGVDGASATPVPQVR
jgi:GPH family glycoside/pentoside/hexuronide:cation symporter